MKNLILYLFLFANCISYSQDRKIDLAQLESKVFGLINDYRESLQVTQLEKESYKKRQKTILFILLRNNR